MASAKRASKPQARRPRKPKTLEQRRADVAKQVDYLEGQRVTLERALQANSEGLLANRGALAVLDDMAGGA